MLVAGAAFYGQAGEIAQAGAAQVAKEFGRIASQGYSRSEETEQLARLTERLGDRALAVLAEQASTEPYSETGRLAVKAIGMVGGTAAIETLRDFIQPGSRVSPRTVVFSLAEIPVDRAVAVLREIASGDGPFEHRLAAATALRWRGDAADVERLREAAAATKNSGLRRQLEAVANGIQFRLTGLPEGETAARWAEYQRTFWPAAMDPPMSRSMDLALREVATGLGREGWLPLVFLNHIADTEGVEPTAVAVQVMGMQGYREEIPRFYELAQRSDSLGRSGLMALIDIGSPDAVALVGDLLSTPGFRYPTIAVEGLVKIGTTQAAEVLERAAGATDDDEFAFYYRARASRIKAGTRETGGAD